MSDNHGETILDKDLTEEELRQKKDKLEHELNEFRREQQKIKELMGSLGGKKFSNVDNILNVLVVCLVIALFLVEILTNWMPVFVSIEIGVLLVSLKIAWMIHSQYKFNHFQFWMLNSMEFRINELFKKMNMIDKKMARLMPEEEK